MMRGNKPYEVRVGFGPYRTLNLSNDQAARLYFASGANDGATNTFFLRPKTSKEKREAGAQARDVLTELIEISEAYSHATYRAILGTANDCCYTPDTLPGTEREILSRHENQLQAFLDVQSDVRLQAETVSNPTEAIVLGRHLESIDNEFLVSFTLDRQGLVNGVPYGEVINQVDDATHGRVDGYLLNCAGLPFIDQALASAARLAPKRTRGFYANASSMFPLDNEHSKTIVKDYEDPKDHVHHHHTIEDEHSNAFLDDYALQMGCCGVDHEHITAFSKAQKQRTATSSPLEELVTVSS